MFSFWLIDDDLRPIWKDLWLRIRHLHVSEETWTRPVPRITGFGDLVMGKRQLRETRIGTLIESSLVAV